VLFEIIKVMKNANLEIRILNRLINEFKFSERNVDLSSSTSSVASAIYKELSTKRFNGKPIPAFLRSVNEALIKVKEPTEEMFDYFYNKLDSNKGDFYDAISTYVNDDVNRWYSTGYKKNEKLDANLASIFYSFLLFTSGSVSTIRKPSGYESWQSQAIKHNNSPYKEIMPIREDYRNAKKILQFAAQTKNRMGPQNLYRGIGLTESVGMNLKAGIQFKNFPISSWTTDGQTAKKFAADSDQDCAIILKVKDCLYGSDVSAASNYDESEVVMGKNLKITAVKFNLLNRSFDLSGPEFKKQNEIWDKLYPDEIVKDLFNNTSVTAIVMCELA
jgi:hypothetical protein